MFDHGFDQITNRQHPDQLTILIHHRQVADVLVGHQRQAMRNVQVGSAVVIWLLAALASMVSTEVGMVIFMLGVGAMGLSVTVYAFVALVGFLG